MKNWYTDKMFESFKRISNEIEIAALNPNIRKEREEVELKTKQELDRILSLLQAEYGTYSLDYEVTYGHGDSSYGSVYLIHKNGVDAKKCNLYGYGNLSGKNEKTKLHIKAYLHIFRGKTNDELEAFDVTRTVI